MYGVDGRYFCTSDGTLSPFATVWTMDPGGSSPEVVACLDGTTTLAGKLFALSACAIELEEGSTTTHERSPIIRRAAIADNDTTDLRDMPLNS